MSQPAKKEKRRIVPMLVVDEKKSSSPAKAAAVAPKKKEHDMRPSHLYNDFLEAVHKPGYADYARDRAVQLGYEKARKPVSEEKQAQRKKKKESHAEHGSHYEHMGNINEYIAKWAHMKAHGKGKSVYEYLKQNYDKGLYLSAKSKRFRKAP
jgi:hypothetical protein